ncbi:hypothetical protein IU470_02420 [Nocardia abscessus]|uniref:Uncharacterized protein n=1 Tax=Nocardia abscessus TaxID=120957 RepID=A0ABS0C5R6_9NOCA|nr:hypothetical protein [Nocardia abscessus]MBF6223979.1 hypothetical protein [Nocardia abscessus]
MDVGMLGALANALRKSWSADTSSARGWAEDNGARGQCAVTACVVQDYFGGYILNTVATVPNNETVSHYFNIVDGKTIDRPDAAAVPAGDDIHEADRKAGSIILNSRVLPLVR